MSNKNKYKGDSAKPATALYNEFMQTANELGRAIRDEDRAVEAQGKLRKRLAELEEAHTRQSALEQERARIKAADEAKKKAKEDAEKKALEGGIEPSGEQAAPSTEPAPGNDAQPV